MVKRLYGVFSHQNSSSYRPVVNKRPRMWLRLEHNPNESRDGSVEWLDEEVANYEYRYFHLSDLVVELEAEISVFTLDVFLVAKELEYGLLTILPSFIQKGALLEGYDGEEELKVKVLAFVIMSKKDYALKILWLAYFLNEMSFVVGVGVAVDLIRASGFGLRVANALRGFGWPEEGVVFVLATLPVVELRGAIPVGYWLQLRPLVLTFSAILG
ncbi:hypothetical protein GIB67_009645 [Kingdonia uniflora]|uniref:Uncharacterized protein n=1 Tax=Kingdonia uniflora TaxID=39325 RepID=A0A7J7LB59_9MAGN|nr:hypothetical protein GIB67_009645 [Kingdonia uniflora]